MRLHRAELIAGHQGRAAVKARQRPVQAPELAGDERHALVGDALQADTIGNGHTT